MAKNGPRKRKFLNKFRLALIFLLLVAVLILNVVHVAVHIKKEQLDVSTTLTSSSHYLNEMLNEFRIGFPASAADAMLEGNPNASTNLITSFLATYHSNETNSQAITTTGQPQQQPQKKQRLLSNQKRLLQVILDQNYLETGSHASSSYLWEESEIIPHWMKEYFHWHTEQRRIVNESNWENHRWIVMQCIRKKNIRCGGLADRLKSFVYVLRQAYKSNRIFLIYYDTPMELENFLLPPVGGIDWRAPPWFQTMLKTTDRGKNAEGQTFIDKLAPKPIALIRARFQDIFGGSRTYTQQCNESKIVDPNDPDAPEPTFDEVYHDVWRIFFTPTKPLAKLITEEMNRMRLRPGQYVAAHLRAMYGNRGSRPESETMEWSQNALNCASKLRPGGPIFFASDLSYATMCAMNYNNITKEKYGSTTRIVTRIPREREPLHFEKMEMSVRIRNKTSVSQLKASDLYETFIDLYIMGMSNGVTFNRGGFGHWGLVIGYNATKGGHMQKTSMAGIGVRCNWTEPATNMSIVDAYDDDVASSGQALPPLFLEPMADYQM